MFYILLLYVHSCFAIIWIGKRERESWLLCLICLPDVSDYCVAIPLGAMGLSAVRDCVIPNLTHSLLLGVNYANSDGFGESAHVLGLV